MEKKVQCFVCRNSFSDPKDLFLHIKHVHKICDKSKCACTLCGAIFTKVGTYKTHVEKCFSEMDVDDEEAVSNRNEFVEAYNAVGMINEDVANFKNLAEKAAFQFACKLNSIMILPRDLVYKIIMDLEKFLKTVIMDGMNEIIIPRVLASEKGTVREFMNVMVSTFSNFTTEWKFDQELCGAGLIDPIEQCAMFAGDDVEDGDGASVLMPLSFQIKKFLELPLVFQKIQDNTADILQKGKLNHFINGSLWKEKVQHYSKDQIVMPYHYYSDAAQLNHPLGPHCRTGEEDFHYYSFPTIPTEYQSRLENIFLLYLHPETHINEFGLEQIFGNVIEELTKLATDGIVINIDSKEYRVFFVCGLFLADSKGANTCLGYQRSHSAIKYCRFCQMKKYDMQKTPRENPATRRNRQNYDEDVLIHDATETGVREYSTLNSIPYFHVTESSAEDLTHIVEEGIAKYNISDALHFLIYEDDDPPFTLDQLNTRMKDFSYGEDEKANKPHAITKKNLENCKLKMTAAETANFIHNLTFMIGDLVPEDNAVWYLIKLTAKFFDYCYLPCYDNEDIEEWTSLIEEMNNMYIDILGQHLKPQHHFATHLPTDTLKCGPLRYARTIRYEGKHRELKGYAKNSNNRMHLSYSIAKKAQYNFAYRLLQSRGLEDIIETKYMSGTIKDKVYYAKLKSSLHKDRLTQQKCNFTDKVTVNGITFIRGMWLPDVPDDGNREIRRLHEIYDIVLVNPTNINDFYAVCKTYDALMNEHYAGYEIDTSSLHSEFEIINIGDFLEKHYYPVTTHKIGDKKMFRCKRF